MVPLLEQILALFVLLCGISIGWRRWVGPLRAELDANAIGMLVLAILAVVGGAVGSVFLWRNDPNSFSWTLSPLAARLLGSAALAFAITGCYALEQRSERLLKAYIVFLAVYLAPLVVAILLFHLDRFNWNAAITYAFFVIAGGMALAAIWHLVRRTALGPSFAGSDQQAPLLVTRCWLWVVAIGMGLWGVSLFLHPTFPLPAIFIWPRNPLTSRLIASMLLTLSTAAVLGIQSTEQARMSLWMFVAYGAAAFVACLWNAVGGKPVPVSYAGAFCGLALGSVLCILYVRDKSRSLSANDSHPLS